MGRVRTAIVVFLVIGLFGLGIRLLAFWAASGALNSVTSSGFEPLASVVEATVGATLARADARTQQGSPAAVAGALAGYVNGPAVLQKDKAYFTTWVNALSITGTALEGSYQLDHWQSSESVPWVALAKRFDAWGHAFCIATDRDYIFAISPGPEGLSSLKCAELRVNTDALKKLPQGRLNPFQGGTLLLVVKKKAMSKHEVSG